MEEVEWQIMLEQFIASGVVVKNEVINIDSDLNFLVVVVCCLRSPCAGLRHFYNLFALSMI
jgi:hypothetical protein